MGCRGERLYHLRFSTEEDRKKGSKCIETVYEYGMDGAILASSYVEKNPAAAQVLQCADGYAAQKLQEFGVMGMLADELAGVSMVMEHLIGLGHQKIAHISGELFSRSGPSGLKVTEKPCMRMESHTGWNTYRSPIRQRRAVAMR